MLRSNMCKICLMEYNVTSSFVYDENCSYFAQSMLWHVDYNDHPNPLSQRSMSHAITLKTCLRLAMRVYTFLMEDNHIKHYDCLLYEDYSDSLR